MIGLGQSVIFTKEAHLFTHVICYTNLATAARTLEPAFRLTTHVIRLGTPGKQLLAMTSLDLSLYGTVLLACVTLTARAEPPAIAGSSRPRQR